MNGNLAMNGNEWKWQWMALMAIFGWPRVSRRYVAKRVTGPDNMRKCAAELLNTGVSHTVRLSRMVQISLKSTALLSFDVTTFFLENPWPIKWVLAGHAPGGPSIRDRLLQSCRYWRVKRLSLKLKKVTRCVCQVCTVQAPSHDARKSISSIQNTRRAKLK